MFEKILFTVYKDIFLSIFWSLVKLETIRLKYNDERKKIIISEMEKMQNMTLKLVN